MYFKNTFEKKIFRELLFFFRKSLTNLLRDSTLRHIVCPGQGLIAQFKVGFNSLIKKRLIMRQSNVLLHLLKILNCLS